MTVIAKPSTLRETVSSTAKFEGECNSAKALKLSHQSTSLGSVAGMVLVLQIELQGLLLRIDLPTIDPEWNLEAEMDGCLLSRMPKCFRQPA